MTSVLPAIINTYRSAATLQRATDKQVKALLRAISSGLVAGAAGLIEANRRDLSRQAPDDPRNDRLLLNEERIRNIAKSIVSIAKLPNPSGKVLEKRTLKNGLRLEKWSVPLGVVGAIYESRPNVTFDIAALCLRSRNACVLKGSSDADETNRASLRIIRQALTDHGFSADTVSLLPPDREVVQEMFTAVKYIDVLIPRGSEGLIQYVRQHSRVPVIETGAGVCHVYVEARANLKKAVSIAVNAKVSRPSVCNAADAILVDRPVAKKFLHALRPKLEEYGVEIFADPESYDLLRGYPHLQATEPADFGREFLSLKCAIKVVADIDDALTHIAEYSTRHSEAIVSENKKACERFLLEVDAAAVYANASTRFTDGEEFGLGAEIGVSTQKLHARGPFALEKLVTEKWVVRGDGQIR